MEDQIHASIDKISDGPKKGVVAIITLLTTIAALLGALLNQSYKIGLWVGASAHTISQNADAISDNAAAIRELTATVSMIATADTLRGAKLDEVVDELRIHRQRSE